MRAETSPLRLLHWDPHFYTHRQFYMWCRSPGQLTLSEQVGFTVWHVVVIGHMWGLILSKTRSRWHPLSSRVHRNRSHLGWDAPRRRKSIFLLCFAITCPVLALFECLKTEKVTQTHHRNFKIKGYLKEERCKMLDAGYSCTVPVYLFSFFFLCCFQKKLIWSVAQNLFDVF